MKISVVIVALLAFTCFSVQKTEVAHAGAGDAILIVAVLGGAAYAGYHFSQNYEVQKKAAIDFNDGKASFQRPTLQYEASEEKALSGKEERYSFALLNLNF